MIQIGIILLTVMIMNKIDSSDRDHVIVINNKRSSSLLYLKKRYTKADAIIICKSLNKKSKTINRNRKFYWQDAVNLCPNTINIFQEKTK